MYAQSFHPACTILRELRRWDKRDGGQCCTSSVSRSSQALGLGNAHNLKSTISIVDSGLVLVLGVPERGYDNARRQISVGSSSRAVFDRCGYHFVVDHFIRVQIAFAYGFVVQQECFTLQTSSCVSSGADKWHRSLSIAAYCLQDNSDQTAAQQTPRHLAPFVCDWSKLSNMVSLAGSRH